MIETIFALLLYLNGKLENYTPKMSIAECLEQKRKVERVAGPSENWSCKEVKAILETDKHGTKSIKEMK